jgi:hypothetical protein
MRIMTSQAGSWPRFDSLMGIDKPFVLQIMAFRTNGAPIFVEQTGIHCPMMLMAQGTILQGRLVGDTVGPETCYFPVAVKAKSWLFLHQVLGKPGAVSQMTTIAGLPGNRFMFYGLGINLLLHLCMAVAAQFSRSGAQHMLKVAGMGAVTMQTLPISKRFMHDDICTLF